METTQIPTNRFGTQYMVRPATSGPKNTWEILEHDEGTPAWTPVAVGPEAAVKRRFQMLAEANRR